MSGAAAVQDDPESVVQVPGLTTESSVPLLALALYETRRLMVQVMPQSGFRVLSESTPGEIQLKRPSLFISSLKLVFKSQDI